MEEKLDEIREVSYKYNQVCYTCSKMTETEKIEWKNEQFQRVLKHFKGVLENISSENIETKRNIRLESASVLFHLKQYDEAVQIYKDGFYVSKIKKLALSLYISCLQE